MNNATTFTHFDDVTLVRPFLHVHVNVLRVAKLLKWNMQPSWPLLTLLSRCPLFVSSRCNIFQDQECENKIRTINKFKWTHQSQSFCFCRPMTYMFGRAGYFGPEYAVSQLRAENIFLSSVNVILSVIKQILIRQVLTKNLNIADN